MRYRDEDHLCTQERPDVFFEYARSPEERGFTSDCCRAGMAAPFFSGNVCSDLPDACDRYSNAYHFSREDVIHCILSYRCHPECRCATVAIRRRGKCRTAGSRGYWLLPDPELREKLESVPAEELKEQVRSKGCPPSGSWISGLLKNIRPWKPSGIILESLRKEKLF